MPFQWTVLTVVDAKMLVDYIEKSTAIPGNQKNYHKIGEKGMLPIYNQLREFVEQADHYEGQLKNLDTDYLPSYYHNH